jgi:hypothetical protein
VTVDTPPAATPAANRLPATPQPANTGQFGNYNGSGY